MLHYIAVPRGTRPTHNYLPIYHQQKTNEDAQCLQYGGKWTRALAAALLQTVDVRYSIERPYTVYTISIVPVFSRFHGQGTSLNAHTVAFVTLPMHPFVSASSFPVGK